MISHLLASPRVRPRRAAPWKAIATPPPPPQNRPEKRAFPAKPKTDSFPTPPSEGGQGPRSTQIPEKLPQKIYLAVSLAVLHGGARFGALLEGFFGWKIADFGTYGRTGRGARPAPAPRALGRFRVFLGILGFFRRRGVPGAKRARKAGFWGHARVRSTKRARKVGFWVQRASPALNGLRKWDFGSGSRPQRKIGSENGVWD